MIAVLGALAIVAAVFGISRVATAPTMACSTPASIAAAAGEVVAALEAEGVAFEVATPRSWSTAQYATASAWTSPPRACRRAARQGYEILDNLSGFGTTSQMFDAAYWRAKEGELARTITGSPNVRAARVHLANPVSQPFSRRGRVASVTVTMARGELERRRREAIRYLVASAVAGLAPEAVAVLDSATGVVLAGNEDAQNGPGSPNATGPRRMRSNVQRLLEARVGPGRAIVEVNVDADTDSQTITERTIDPESRVAISSEAEENKENAQGTNPGVTVASNLPDGAASGARQSKCTPTTTASGRTSTSPRPSASGSSSRARSGKLSVAVMVDGITDGGRRRQDAWAPRPQEEMDTLSQLVQSAIGFDAARGDTVTIESLAFTAAARTGHAGRAARVAVPRRAGRRGWRRSACSGPSCWR